MSMSYWMIEGIGLNVNKVTMQPHPVAMFWNTSISALCR